MKKRVISLFTVFILLVSMCSIVCLAAEESPQEPLTPDEPYVDLAYYNCGLEINSNGRAYAHTFAETAHTNYQIYLQVEILRFRNGYWQHYAGPWSGSGTSYAAANKYYYVVPGYYYCASSFVTVYDGNGNFVEATTLYSPTTYY